MSSISTTGQLPVIEDIDAVYLWPVEYAPIVHDGATLKSGARISARPWTERGLDQLDIDAAFERAMQRTGDPEAAFRQVALQLDGEFKKAISDPVWDWPRATIRTDGELVPAGKRNIVDRGQLRASQQLEFS